MGSESTATVRRKEELPPLLKAKLSRPNPGELVLDRPHLVRALADHRARPLTLVIADAGYGKTTLVNAFSRSAPRPVVWYSLMPSDGDVVVFGRYLLEGFRRESPRFGRAFERALEEVRPGARSVEMLGGTLANELASLKGPPCLLVLDDFQEVSGNPEVIGLVDAVLRHLPPAVRVLLASRSLPPLALERMRARGEVFELDSSHMRFTREELGRLFHEVYRRGLGEEELTALEETTLGWPTAVHLVYESLRRGDDVQLEDVLASFRASNLELHDYLSAEVITRLDAQSRRLIERTAALGRFDVELAAALTGIRGPIAALDGLARRGLLRTYGTAAQRSYQCHDLVRRFVRQEVENREGPGGWQRLEADTAVALQARGEPERALRHYLVAGCVEEAAGLVRDLAPALLRQGRAAAVLQYVTDLPAERVRDDLRLALAGGDAQLKLGAWNEAEKTYESALERARREGERGHECHALWGLGRLLNFRGKYEQVLGIAESGLARAHDLDLETRARLLQIKAAAHFYLGQYRAAIAILDQVRSDVKPPADPELLVPTVHNLAMAYAAQGRFREASRELRAALAQVRGTSSPRAPLYLSNLAFLLADLGELAEARKAAEEGLLAAQRFSNRPQEATCHEALAQIQAETGDLDGALASLRRAEELNAELRMELIAAHLLALRGRIFCARGEYRRAVEYLDEAVQRIAARPDDPLRVDFQATLAWCELRAGRVNAAKDLLLKLLPRADADENEHRRMRVHYWLAEARLALGEPRGADEHLALALRLVREHGYLHFLRGQAREDPAPLLHALARGIEVTTVSGALIEAGAAVETSLLEILEVCQTAAGEAALSVLAEVGGQASRATLERLEKKRRALKPAIRTALKHITERAARGAIAEVGPEDERPARLILFGPPQLEVAGRPVSASAWRAQRAFHVLVYLALHPRGASRDELLERFWPGRQAAAGRRNFHPTLSYIRSVLPRASVAPILREAEFYRLNPNYPLTSDAWDLERALEEVRGARAPAARRMALRTAAGLAIGPFLHGLYMDWADELQARMRDRMEKLLLELGGLCARAADFEEALEHFRRAAELDEYREATRLSVIECLIKVGNRRAALAEYDRLKAVLKRELDVDPLPETESAMRQILDGKSVHDWPEGGLPVSSEIDEDQAVTAHGQVHLKAAARGYRP